MRFGYSQKLRMGLVVVGSLAMAVPMGMSTYASAHLAGAGGRAADVEPQCQIHTPKPFVEAGEGATHSSVAGVFTVQCRAVYAQSTVTITADELNSRCFGTLVWSTPPPINHTNGQSFDVKLDDNGEALASFWGGPSCAAGTSLICAHLDVPPFTTVCNNFTILSPRNTPPGVKALPATQVEDSINSSAETVIYVEFPSVFSQKVVKIQSQELFARCAGGDRIVWIGPDFTPGNPIVGPYTFVTLDNNGNAFVSAEAGPSCASGTSTIEASLTVAPFTTYTTTFTILSPRATCTPKECD